MIYTFANCELDTELFELRRDGVLEGVEPQVFEVLAYLVAHRDRVVSRDELLAQVWGHAYVSDTALTSRLMDARKAVGDSGRAQQLIRTVRGRGYRFVGDVQERAATEPAVGSEPRRVAPRMAGREAERSRLDELLAKSLAGARQVALITGEPGLGKTTLIEAFLADATSRTQLLVGSARCVDQRGAVEPYMPVLEALAEIATGPDADRVVATLGRVAPTWLVHIPWLVDDATLTTARDRALGARPQRMLREIAHAVDALCAISPVVLVLDDLHWADESTLELVNHLARSDDPARLLVLGAARPTQDHPINVLLRELVPRGRCVQVELPPLGEDAIGQYVEQRCPGLNRDDLVSALRGRTDGNPLFMDCLVGSWLEAGALGQVDGRWVLRADPQQIVDQLPDTLRGLIEQDVGRLDPEDQRVVEAGSAAGLAFSARAIAPAAGTSDEEAEIRCTELARHGRIVERRDPVEWPDGTTSATFAFNHDLHRQVLYESLPAGQRSRIHRDIATRLEAAYAGRAREHSAELAAHYLAAGVADAAVRYLELAAEQASSRGAPREALAHVRRALDLVSRDASIPDSDGHEMWLLASLAAVHVALDGYSSAEGERAYLRALELARSVGDDGFTAILLYRFAGMHELRGEYATSEALLEEALRIQSEPEPARLVETHELMACSLFHQGSFDAALEHANLGLSNYEPGQRYPDPAFEGEHPAVACNDWAGLVLWCLGRFDQANARIESALALAAQEGHLHGLASARIFAAHLHHLRREPEAAREYAEAALALASERQVAYQIAVARILLGWSLSRSGDREEGIELMRRGLRGHEETGARMDRPYFLGMLSHGMTSAGRPDEGLATADEALELVSGARSFFYEPELHRLRAVAMLEEDGDRAGEAESSLRRGLSVARARGARALELRVLIDLARLPDGSALRDEARALLQEACSWFGEGVDSVDLREARDMLS